MYRSQEKYAESIADFNRAIELVPGNGTAYLERGTTYMYANNYGSALSDFTRVIELLPNSSEPYYYRGLIYLDQSEYDKAIADFSRVLELEPTWPDAYGSRGKAHTSKAEYEAAIQDYTRAIELAPDEAEGFYFDRAEAYRLQGDNARAIADYQVVVEQTDQDWLRTEAAQRLKLLEDK